MKRRPQLLQHALRTFGGAVGAFLLWMLWLGLVAALVVQIYVLTTSELTVPQFVVRRIEARLAENGLKGTFARTSFDPTGRVLLEDARLTLPAFAEPVVHARAAYVRLNPWMLVVGQVEPREVRLSGVTVAVPAMLSPSGQPQEIIRELDATIVPAAREVTIAQLSGRVAGVSVTARGTLPIPRARRDVPDRTIAEFLEKHFANACRQAIVVREKLAAFQEPALDLEFSLSEAGAPQIGITLLARGIDVAQPFAARASALRLEARVLMVGNVATVSRIDAAADELQLPFADGIVARGVRAAAFGRVQPEKWRFEPRTIEVTADAVTAAGVPLQGVSAELFPRPLPKLEGAVFAHAAGSPLALRGETDLDAGSAALRFDGALSPEVLDLIGRRVKTDVRKYFDFAAIDVANGEARFAPQWKFEGVSARLRLQRVNGHGVIFDRGLATVHFDGKRFHSPDAFATIGQNFAHGSYEHELGTHRYRFLLEGRLRPMDIAPWFQSWWPNFFQQLEFPAAPPNASVEVSGQWGDGRESAVFVAANALKPVIRGAALDRVRTRLFIRPGFFDGLELAAAQGPGTLAGTFTYALDAASRQWRTFDFDAESTVDLALVRKIGGEPAVEMLAPFEVAAPPEVRVRGHVDGPAVNPRRHDVTIAAHTAGEFRFFHFPLQDASFTARLRDDEIVIDRVEARFGGGATTGRARVWGTGAERRLGFDYALKGANLGEAAAALEQFMARQAGRPPAPPGKFVQEKASVRIDLAASAEGRYADKFSYRGTGNAALEGAEIGEVPLLGALSELLKFTALRFTSARANFAIEGPKVVFPEIAIRGANSGIDAHGAYHLDRHELDFNAKIFPFQESGNLIKTVVGAVLSPLSNVFEVKLSGSLAKPAWGLAALAADPDEAPAPPDAAAPKPNAAPAAPAAAPEPARATPGPGA